MATNYMYKLRLHFSWTGKVWQARLCTNTERDGFKVGKTVQDYDEDLQVLYKRLVTKEAVRRLQRAMREYNHGQTIKEEVAVQRKKNWRL
jgi:hypothetical protein